MNEQEFRQALEPLIERAIRMKAAAIKQIDELRELQTESKRRELAALRAANRGEEG